MRECESQGHSHPSSHGWGRAGVFQLICAGFRGFVAHRPRGTIVAEWEAHARLLTVGSWAAFRDTDKPNYKRLHVLRKLILLTSAGANSIQSWVEASKTQPRSDLWRAFCNMAPDQGEYVDGWPSRFRSPRHWSRVMNGTGPMYFKMWACMFSVASKHQAIEEWLTTAVPLHDGCPRSLVSEQPPRAPAGVRRRATLAVGLAEVHRCMRPCTLAGPKHCNAAALPPSGQEKFESCAAPWAKTCAGRPSRRSRKVLAGPCSREPFTMETIETRFERGL